MNGLLYNYFTNDHRRLDRLFNKSTMDPEHYDMEMYKQFRAGLLKHIKMEETMLFPNVKEGIAGESLSLTAKLRLDHGALTLLMVPPPSPAIIRALRFILELHNKLEEEPGGLYDQCDKMNQNVIQELVRKIEAATEVSVLPFRPEPFVIETARRVLKRAGYNYEDFENEKS